MKQAPKQPTLYDKLLKALNLDVENLEKAGTEASCRIEFENRFALEVQQIDEGACRISTRLTKLGQNLSTQEKQVEKAVRLYGALKGNTTARFALGISNHDRCLRLISDLEHFDFPNTEQAESVAMADQERLSQKFYEFAEYAYAYKATYLSETTQ